MKVLLMRKSLATGFYGADICLMKLTEKMNIRDREELLHFHFPPSVVHQTLKDHGIPSEKWEPIVSELAVQDALLRTTVKEKAGSSGSQKSKSQKDKKLIQIMFKEILFDVFSTTLEKFGIAEEAERLLLFEDVQMQKVEKFQSLIVQEQEISASQPSE